MLWAAYIVQKISKHLTIPSHSAPAEMGDTIVENCWQTAITVRPILRGSFAKAETRERRHSRPQ